MAGGQTSESVNASLSIRLSAYREGSISGEGITDVCSFVSSAVSVNVIDFSAD